MVGVRGFFDANGNMTSVGITCALCHSTVDDAVAVGIGRPRDGWPNRDLDVGRVIYEELASTVDPFARKDDAAFEWKDEQAPTRDNPFAALEKLKRQRD